ncbi:MAG: hypothetical protein KTR14_05570, partial [Vampirovibrio sp.]|nr:hypothetical protein [Vampirovibrio sp.]
DGMVLPDLNIGGGIGVAYTSQDHPLDVGNTLEQVCAKLKAYAQKLDYPMPRLVMEPGRSMVATSGVTLYTIGSDKQIPNGRKYMAIDGGMGDNIRPSLYQAEYTSILANKAGMPNDETVTIAGKYCESGDILIQNASLPMVEAGDTLLVFGTGAYNYTMSSNYNRVPRPAMVLVNDGKDTTLLRRETYDDLLQMDSIPVHLDDASASGETLDQKSSLTTA